MFTFKHFSVSQDRCAMKVGTDGVLLGSWCPVHSAKRVLDIGTGTGLLALMLAQRSDALIDAVEIDFQGATQAAENVKNSPWMNRIKVWNESIQEYCSHSQEKYDLLVCNPPFFSKSLKSPDEKRSTARHNETLSYQDLIFSAGKLLSENGVLSLILPFSDSALFIDNASKFGFYLWKETDVFPTPFSAPKRKLMAFSFLRKKVESTCLTIELKRNEYTEEYKSLTKDFYLKF